MSSKKYIFFAEISSFWKKSDFFQWEAVVKGFHFKPHLLKSNLYVGRKQQDAEGIQNMSGVSLIGLIFIKWKQTPHFCSDTESLMGNKPVYKIKNRSKKHKNSI